MTTTDEIWRPVVGREGWYEVSNLGRVRSLDRVVPILSRRGSVRSCLYRGRLLKSCPDKRSGHLHISLGAGSVRKVHHLVLEAFVGPCPPGMQCLHGDGDPTNNALANIKWGTASENMLDRVRHGVHHETNKTHCPSGHPYDSANTYVFKGRRNCRACKRASERRAYGGRAAA